MPAISEAGWTVETFPELKNGTRSVASLLSVEQLDAVKPHLEKLCIITTPTLISSENFSRLTEAQAKFMLNTIGINDVSVVYYLRNPLHRLLSAWTERVRHGYRKTLTEYIADRLLRPFRDRDINDKVRITPWAHALGQTAVKPGALDLHLYDQYDDVVKHFFSEYFGIAIDDSEENTRLHVSADVIRIEILRALHGYQTYLAGEHSFSDDLASLKRHIEIIISGDREAYIHKLELSLDNTVMRRIGTSLIEDYGSSIRQSWGESRLFNDREITWEYLSPDIWLEHAELAKELWTLREKILNAHGAPNVAARSRIL